jgi:hypothetical protein
VLHGWQNGRPIYLFCFFINTLFSDTIEKLLRGSEQFVIELIVQTFLSHLSGILGGSERKFVNALTCAAVTIRAPQAVVAQTVKTRDDEREFRCREPRSNEADNGSLRFRL